MNRRTASFSIVFLACLAAASTLAACGDAPPSKITEVRNLEEPRGRFPPHAPMWHRFGLPPPQGAQPKLGWDLPAGWKHAPTQSRPYNFVIEGDAETSAYLTALGKVQGTLTDNVNRWRRQMGLDPVDQAAVDALPRKPIFGNEAIFVDVAGAFKSMAGGEPKAGWRLLGLMFDAVDQYVFFKMVGPDATVSAQRAGFLSLAASFRRERAGSPEAASPRPPPKKAGKLTWKTPTGWTSKGRSGMREVTFSVEGTEASCWVLFLPGSAGGLTANVNRWLREVGNEALSEDQIAKLERLDVLGTQGVIVDGEGNYQGMGGPATKGARLFGLICPLEGRTLFVKMVGPADAMSTQRENFIALCKSLASSE